MAYGMQEEDQMLRQVDQLFLEQCPLPKFRAFFSRFTYENKMIYPALSLIKSSELSRSQRESAVKFLTALELVNLGFSLHHSIGSKLNVTQNRTN
jgi:hypothetical protein